MRASTFITIAIATLMVSTTQASEFEKRESPILTNSIGPSPFYNSGGANRIARSQAGDFKKFLAKRDIQVIGLPGTGTSGGKMVTNTGYGTSTGGSSGFYNKRGGVKVHPERKRAVLLDTSGSVTSGGFGKMKIDTATTIVKRACNKVHPEHKKATEKLFKDHHEKRVFSLLGGLLNGNPFLDAHKKFYRKRSGKRSHHGHKRNSAVAKHAKDNHSGSHHGKRNVPVVGDLLSGDPLKKDASKVFHDKRAGVKVHPSVVAMEKRGLVKGSGNHAPSNAHPDRPEDVNKDIIVLNNSGNKI